MDEVVPRHGDHHNINIKYGYFIFALTIIQIIFFFQVKFIQIKRWNSTGRFSKFWSQLTNPPIWLMVTIWLLIVIFTGGHKISDFLEEYIISAKRYGRMAYCLIPLNIYLVLRPTNSPLLKPGYYLENMNLHKWTSRIIVFCSAIHAAGYIYKWVKEGTILNKPFRFLNLLGVIVFVFLVVLAIISVRTFRKKIYSTFYLIHNITAWSMVILITFHARPGVTIFAVISILLLGYQLYLRYYSSYLVNSLKVIDIPTSTLQIIKIPQPNKFPNWLPGSHIRLSYTILKFKSWTTATHPFTIVTIPEDSANNLTLIVKKPNQFVIYPLDSYLLTGPYPSLAPPFFTTANIVNIICGGSGISLGLPIYHHFKSINLTVSVKLVWTVRNQNDTFIMNQLDMTGVQVYVTSIGDTNSELQENQQHQAVPLFVIEEEEEEEGHGLLNNESENGIELQNMPESNEENSETITINSKNNKDNEERKEYFKFGRPKFDEVFAIDDPTTTHDLDNSWVIACGPDELISDAKRWSKDRGYRFYYEKYEM